MPNTNEDQAASTDTADAAPATDGPKTKNVELKIAVAGRIAGANAEIADRVVERLAAAELQRREDAVIKIMDKISETEKALRAVKPDNVTYNLDGSVKDTSFNKATIDAKKKNEELLAKLNAALDKAYGEKPGWSKVFELAK